MDFGLSAVASAKEEIRILEFYSGLLDGIFAFNLAYKNFNISNNKEAEFLTTKNTKTHEKKTDLSKFTLFPSPFAKAMGDRSAFSLQSSVWGVAPLIYQQIGNEF